MPRYTVKSDDGVWIVSNEAGGRVWRSDRKREARLRGRDLVRDAGGGELVVMSANGRIREVDTIGADPSPPRRR